MSRPSCAAIIPARGGSKGLPRKNILPLCGLPLIAHAIQELKAATHVDSVWVSTDDEEIAGVARRFGASVIIRPAELSSDAATSESALLHAAEQLGTSEPPDLLMMVQCTSPLTRAEDFDGLVKTLIEHSADSAFTASPFHHFLWECTADGEARAVNHEGFKRKRRQDLQPQFLENGAAYLVKRELFQQTGERFSGKVALHAMDEARTLEIDSPADFVRAEGAMRAVQQTAAADLLPSPLRALVMDFDGVFTDNRVLVSDDGHESVFCSRGDGMGLDMVEKLGIARLILSKERNPVVQRRADKLRLECLHAVDDKPTALKRWLAEHEIEAEHTVYIGNDVNDLGCMAMVGCSVAPQDAHPEALAIARLVLQASGGKGALRELCDLIAGRG